MKTPRIIDITLSLGEPIKGFEKRVSRAIETDGWNASELTIYSHAGTHMDAPVHFGVSKKTIDHFPVERFMCNCHIIRLDGIKPSSLIGPEVIRKIENKIKEGEGIIFHTGWSRRIDDPETYRNLLPRLSEELVLLMVSKKINLVGVEPPSVANVNDIKELQNIHRILFEADIIILEGLCNLDQVRKDYVKLIALPMKIRDGDGAPVRAIIIEN